MKGSHDAARLGEDLESRLHALGEQVPDAPEWYVAPTLYFRSGGRGCTELTLEAAFRRAVQIGAQHFLLATTTGFTAERAYAAMQRHGWAGQLVVITEHTGYHAPGTNLFPDELRSWFRDRGVVVHTATHAFSSIARSFRIRWSGIELGETVAESFRRVSRGTKTCLEIAVMAADAGIVPPGTDVVAVGGASRGCDTALVVSPSTMNYFFELKVREVIALPRLRDSELGLSDKGTPTGAVQKTAG